MIEQLYWLGKKEELEFQKLKFKDKLAVKIYLYSNHVDGVIRTRAVIFLMALLVLIPVAFVPSLGLFLERAFFAGLIIIAGLMFNKFRIAAILLSVLPILLILYFSVTVPGFFNTRVVGGYLGIVALVLSGIYHHYKLKAIEAELNPHILENHLLDD